MVADRLPKVGDLETFLTDIGSATYYNGRGWDSFCEQQPEWWLEEVTLPIKAELEEIAEEFAIKIATRPDTISRLNAESWFKAGFNAAIELIKGGAK